MSRIISSTTNTANSNVPSNDGLTWKGGKGTFNVVGTFDTSTVKLQHSPDRTNWIDTGTDTEVTVAGGAAFEIMPGDEFEPTFIRVNIASVGGSTDVDIFVDRDDRA